MVLGRLRNLSDLWEEEWEGLGGREEYPVRGTTNTDAMPYWETLNISHNLTRPPTLNITL